MKLIQPWHGWANLDRQIWVLVVGRLLSALGSGLTLFYLPVFFVNQVGLPATLVGLGLGLGSVAGIVGRILGGNFTDAQTWGRRKTLLLATLISAIGSLGLAVADNFPSFVVSNLVVGLGTGLYWPPSEAIVADLSAPAQRQQAYAITRLADSVGLGLGIILGGGLISLAGAYRLLFWLDALSFAVFSGIVYWAVQESGNRNQPRPGWLQSWRLALSNRRLLLYASLNVLLTLYVSQIQATLPLYLTNYVHQETPISSLMLTGLLAWHLIAAIALQLPVVRLLSRYRHPQALMISAGCWALGFGLVWITGAAQHFSLVWAVLALGVLALATVAYTPSASALVAEIAPEHLRGVYLSINSLCWAAGYALGPPLGGWALDRARPVVDYFWLVLALSTLVVVAGLVVLDRQLRQQT